MAHTGKVLSTFREGDEVVLVEGTYQGTLGVFVRLRDDVGWADIAERNGAVRSHPVAWLGHAVEGTRSAPQIAASIAPLMSTTAATICSAVDEAGT